MFSRKIIYSLAIIFGLLVLGAATTVQAQCIDSMLISNGEGDPGQQNIVVPVYGRVCEYDNLLKSVNFLMQWDSTALVLNTVLYEVTDPVYQSFYDVYPNPMVWSNTIGSNWTFVGIIFNLMSPGEVEPGRYRMFDLVFDVADDAAPNYYTLDFEDGLGSPPKDNVFAYSSLIIHPDTVNGTFRVKGEMYGAIEGVVVNGETLDPIEDAYVRANGYSDQTNQYGEYLISNLSSGTYDVIAIAFGFEPDTVGNVVVTVGHTTNVDFELTPSECVNTLFCGGGSGIGGDTIKVPITAMNCSELDGYTVSLTYDNKLLIPLGIDTTGTATGSVSPDTFRYHFAPGSGVVPGCVLVQCIISSDHSRFIPVGTNKLFDIVFEGIPNPSDTADFELKVYPSFPWPGGEPLENEFVFGDFRFTPNLEHGQFVMLSAFVRGDYDGDGLYTLADALAVMNWYFETSGSVPPTCLDAVDYNDDGAISLEDVKGYLDWYFEVPGSPPPAQPIFHCGSDPTPSDAFECDWHQTCMSGGEAAAYKPPVSVEGAANRIVVGTASVVDGKIIVPVDMVASEPVAGYVFTVGYDESQLELVKVVGGDGYDFYNAHIRGDGTVLVGGVPDLEMVDLLGAGEHRVAELVFEVTDELRSDVGLHLSDVEAYGVLGSELALEWVDGLVKRGVNLPKEFALSQNYPNPFNPTTLIKYDLPGDCQVRLYVYNVVGQRVATLVDGHQKAGYKLVTWNARDIASGVYFYKLTAGGFTAIRKMVLLK